MSIVMNLMVRPTGILVEDEKILLVKQDVTETRHWALPGGRLEIGETVEQCLVREIKEETGLDIEIKELLYITDRFYGDNHIVHILFLVNRIGGRLRSGEELKSETETIKELAMVSFDKLRECGFPEKMCRMIKENFPERGGYKGDFENFYGKL
jgi:mutator protein MutT